MLSREAEFLDHLYAASVGAGGWNHVLSAYRGLVGGHAAVAIVTDMATGQSRPVEWLNVEAEHVRAGLLHWQHKDPWVAASRTARAAQPDRFRHGLVMRGSERLSRAEVLDGEWYNEYGKHALAQDCVSTVGISGGRHMLVLSAQTGGSPPRSYSAAQQEVAERILPHVHRALDLQIRTGSARNLAQIQSRFADLSVPVLTLAGREILASNAAAESELELGRIVRRLRGKFWAQDSELDRLIAAMGRRDAPRQAVLTATASDGCLFLVQCIRFNQLRGSLLESAGADAPALVLVLTQLGSKDVGRRAAIESMRMFTPVEQAIALSLVSGGTVESIARERRTSVGTVRWHIKNMAGKSGCQGALALTRMLSLLLPL